MTLATYVFFIFTVIGRQKIDTLKKGDYMRSGRMPMDIDLYIPIYTILQFFFYMGLLKVTEIKYVKGQDRCTLIPAMNLPGR